MLLSEHELSDVTVRAEVSRLRRLVGPLLSESRPYRLTAPLRTDADMVHALLDTGDVDAALTAYPGPVLARSVAPGVERIRDELAADVRAAVLASPLPGVVSRWLASDAGADDWQAWERLAWLAPKGSPVHVRAVGRLDLLGTVSGRPGTPDGPARIRRPPATFLQRAAPYVPHVTRRPLLVGGVDERRLGEDRRGTSPGRSAHSKGRPGGHDDHRAREPGRDVGPTRVTTAGSRGVRAPAAGRIDRPVPAA